MVNGVSESSCAGSTSDRAKPTRAPVFVTTHWTAVLAAGQGDTTHARDAFAELCQTYWYPLYSYIRLRGYSPHDSQDLTQQFFAGLLGRKAFAGITREKGRFRSFLLTALKHFLVDEWRKSQREKRGGGRVISLDAEDAERRFALEPRETLTPERAFEQNWALALLDKVFDQLNQELEAENKGHLFSELKFCLTGERSPVPYVELAARLNVPENTVKTLVRRLRQRYRARLRQEVANTVDHPDEIEDELRFLFRALSS